MHHFLAVTFARKHVQNVELTTREMRLKSITVNAFKLAEDYIQHVLMHVPLYVTKGHLVLLAKLPVMYGADILNALDCVSSLHVILSNTGEPDLICLHR